jgi:hypothetical protein
LKPKRKGNYHHNGHIIHGLFRGNEHLFNLWQTMKQRCYNPKRKNYERYGGRGITVCDDWLVAENFIRWALSNGYKEGLQLDRIDNSKGYSPDNCRWVTAKQNSQNTRKNITLTIKGITNCVSEWARIYNISPYTIYWWVKEKGENYAIERLSVLA